MPFIPIVVAVIAGVAFLFSNNPIGGDGTISQLQQWSATTSPISAITQSVFGRPLKITGLNDGCVELVNGLATTTTGLPCGSGGSGGGGGFPIFVQNGGATQNVGTTTLNFTPNSFTLVESPADTFAIRVATSTLGLLASAIGDFSSAVRALFSTNIQGLSYNSSTGVLSTSTGYFLPTTTRASNWDTAFSWGNHASQGYITDGNTNWDNSYGFVTQGQTVGTTTAGNPGDLAYWTGIRTLGNVATGTLTESVSGLQFDNTRGVIGGSAVLSLSTGFVIPSTTPWSDINNFYNVPSTRITAGTGLSWSGNTLNASSLGGGSNWLFNGTRLTPSTTAGIVINASSTISELNTTSATATTLYIASKLYGAGLSSCSDGITSKVLWNAATGQFSCGTDQAGVGGGGGGGWATTTDTNNEVGETVTYNSTDVYIGGSASNTAEFNFDKDASRFTISSTTANATGSILSSSGILSFGSESENLAFNVNTANTLRLFSPTGINLIDFLTIGVSTTNATATTLASSNICLSGDCRTAWPVGGSGGGSNWLFNGTSLTPSSTAGIRIFSSSTITDLSMTNATATNATTTNLRTTQLGVGSDYLTDITGNGLSIASNALTCLTASVSVFGCLTSADWTSFNGRVSSSSIDTLAELETLQGGINIIQSTEINSSALLGGILGDETGSGNVVFSASPTLSGLLTFGNMFGTNATITNATATNLYIAGKLYGAGLTTCSDSVTSKLLWNSVTGQFSCGTDQSGGGGGGGGGWATTTDNNAENGEIVTYNTTDVYIGGSASNTAEFNFDKDSSKLTISSTTANATGTIYSTSGVLGFGSETENIAFNVNTANVLRLFSPTGITLVDFLTIGVSTTNATATTFASNNICLGGDCRTAWPVGGSGGGSNWLFNGTSLTPSSTVGILVNASSTIDTLSVRLGTTTNATSTTLFSALGTFTNLFVNTLLTAVNAVFTGLVDIGAGVLEIPNGTAPVVDSIGELAFDSTDDQLLVADAGGTARVIGVDEFRVISLTIASSSARFESGKTLPVLGHKDGLEITQYRCYVIGGTSKVVNLTDGTNDTETITCGTTMTSDTDVATNDTFTADELGSLEMGATTGVVDYLHFEAYARITRE
jgi:hypothetical protein